MLPKPSEVFKDKDQQEIIEHIFQEGQGKIIDLSAAPTASAPLLDADEVGKFEDKIYWRRGEKIYEITPSTTITIT